MNDGGGDDPVPGLPRMPVERRPPPGHRWGPPLPESRAKSRQPGDEVVPAEPGGFQGERLPRERELEEKNAGNAQLEKRVAELERRLGVAKEPDLGPPAGPLRPYSPEGP
jgi:hypothetical protein